MSVIIAKGKKLRADIISNLYHRNPLSLTDLSKKTRKSLPLVTSVINDLIVSGYVIEQGLAPSTGGRRPSVYLLNPEHPLFIVAVAMDQLITRLSIYNLSGTAIGSMKYLEFNMSDPNSHVDTLTDFISSSIQDSGIDKKNIIGVGIGMPGLVQAELGTNLSFLPVKNGMTLQSYLKKKIRLPVFIDNDSSLIALAELNFGEATDLKDVLIVNMGWGTGLGIIINGALYRGSSGYAGEFSHIPLSDSDNLCSCGKRGCLELDTSLLVMAEKARKALEEGAASILCERFKDERKAPLDHFLDAVAVQDPLAVSILSKAGFQLGKGLATLIHILNPQCIVLSGRGAKAGKMLLPSIQQAINQFCIPRIAEQTILKISRLTDEAELLAAASLVVENSVFN